MTPLAKVTFSSFIGAFLGAVLVVGGSVFYFARYLPATGSQPAVIAPAQAAAPAARTQPAQALLSIATGGTGGVYYPLGGAVASVINAVIPNMAATHVSTSGSVDNIQRVVSKTAEIGFAQADAVWDAYKGYGKFSSPQPVRAIAVLYPERLQLVTLNGSNITKVGDLRGKRVSTGATGSGVEFWGRRLLEAHGLDIEKDIVRSSLGIAESAAALKERKIDAFIWAGGVPTKGIADFAGDPQVKIRLLDTGSAVTDMLRKYGPVYTDGTIPANTYSGQPQPVRSAEVWTLLVVREDMDEQLVYNLVKGIFENKEGLVAGHAQARDIELAKQAGGGSPIPFHAGARKYYTEKGLKVH